MGTMLVGRLCEIGQRLLRLLGGGRGSRPQVVLLEGEDEPLMRRTTSAMFLLFRSNDNDGIVNYPIVIVVPENA